MKGAFTYFTCVNVNLSMSETQFSWGYVQKPKCWVIQNPKSSCCTCFTDCGRHSNFCWLHFSYSSFFSTLQMHLYSPFSSSTHFFHSIFLVNWVRVCKSKISGCSKCKNIRLYVWFFKVQGVQCTPSHQRSSAHLNYEVDAMEIL